MTRTAIPFSPVQLEPVWAAKPAAKRWMFALGVLLAGYAILDKGFAYIGVPPLYVGEIVLLCGIGVALMHGRLPALLDARLSWLLLAFCAWGAIRTMPFIKQDGPDALRDAAMWGYAAYLFVIVALLLAQPALLRQTIPFYRLALRVILICTLVVTAAYRLLYLEKPMWPGTDVPILAQKEGDVLVHMAGIVAFWMAGLEGRVRWPWVILLAINIGIMAALDRAGMLAVVVVVGICTLARPRSRIPWKLAFIAVTFVLMLWLTNLRVEIPGGKGRDLSFEQLTTNVESLTSDTGEDGIDSTKEWRLDWWNEIISYTINGKYFWTGKGFGVNLADDDGFQVLSSGKLRAPHDIHMDFLARMGVPGLCMWGMILLSIAGMTVASFFRATREHQQGWSSLFLFLFCYWLACVINASFDVFIEGPMGGIWFWSLSGFLVGASWIYQKHPDLLDQP